MRTALVLLLLGAFASTVAPMATAQQSIVDQFEVRSQTEAGFTLPYRLFVPQDYDSTVAYPLVLALHGAGERGTDNERHIRPHRLATSWADPANQAQQPAFVVAPQVPPDGRWTAQQPVEQSTLSDEERTTLAILDSLAVEFNIDPNRVYVTGLSMGGHGTWDLIARLPHRFAAAVPMSGEADPTQADETLHIPIWAFHGESDPVVPASGSRGIIYAMENLGRDVLYTECRRSLPHVTNFDCPDPISGDSLDEAIEEHADLIYTGVENGGHGPWDVWYDHPLLADWLFSKYRVDPDAITVEAPSPGAVWMGERRITWSASGPATDTVEVWLSLDRGATWQHVSDTMLSAGGVALDTTPYADTPFAQVRLFVKNDEGFIYGRHTSASFVIDNAGDATPVLMVNDEPLRFHPRVTTATLNLDVLAADPERSLLTADIFYSIDGGGTYARMQAVDLQSSQDPQILSLPVADVPNAQEARVRIDLSDGTHTTSAATVTFEKENAREANDTVEHVQGEGTGTVTMHFIEPDALTGHRYQIRFEVSETGAKTYNVSDLDRGTTVLTGVPLSDGVRESPLFDGMRLVVQDLEEGGPDLEQTGWIAGDSDLGVSISGGSVLISVLRVQLLETEADYVLNVTDAVADTSESLFGFPAQEMRFTVTRRSDGARRPVLYRDTNGDGVPGDGDVLYILEEDATGALAPAWEFRFSETDRTIVPEPGDTFLFVPLRTLSADDVFEFVAAEGVAREPPHVPDASVALSSYPNPFADRMTIAYQVAVSSHVTLEVYDLLGRLVARLWEGAVPAGAHHLAWGMPAMRAGRLASGIYLLRMTATPLDGGPSRRVQRTLVQVQ